MSVVTRTRILYFDVCQVPLAFACGRGILVALHISYRWCCFSSIAYVVDSGSQQSYTR